MVYTKTYSFTYFYSQYLVLFNMVPRNTTINTTYCKSARAAVCILIYVTERCTAGCSSISSAQAIDIKLRYQGISNQYQNINMHTAGAQERKTHTYQNTTHGRSLYLVHMIIHSGSLSICCLVSFTGSHYPILPTSHTHETQQEKSLQQGCI